MLYMFYMVKNQERLETMKKFLLALVVALAYASLFAALDIVELGPGGAWESPGCRALAVRAVSSVASGTANVAGVYIAPGEKVGWSGTAKGRVWLFIEK